MMETDVLSILVEDGKEVLHGDGVAMEMFRFLYESSIFSYQSLADRQRLIDWSVFFYSKGKATRPAINDSPFDIVTQIFGILVSDIGSRKRLLDINYTHGDR